MRFTKETTTLLKRTYLGAIIEPNSSIREWHYKFAIRFLYENKEFSTVIHVDKNRNLKYMDNWISYSPTFKVGCYLPTTDTFVEICDIFFGDEA